MSTVAYRTTVLGAILSSFLAGLHVPALHQIIDHGARPRWDIVVATAVLVATTMICGWKLLRSSR